MKTYSIRLAELGYVYGHINVEAENWEQAAALAKAEADEADWSTDEDGNLLRGSGDTEFVGGFCDEEAEDKQDHEGEDPPVPINTYLAAPELVKAITGLLRIVHDMRADESFDAMACDAGGILFGDIASEIIEDAETLMERHGKAMQEIAS